MIETDPLLERLLAKDENAFRVLVRRYHRTMISVARSFVGSQATAEEVAQDTWLAVINGLAGFEGRSTLKNWIFGILVNKARTRAGHESRMSNFADTGPDSSSPVDPARFGSDGSWTEPPSPWEMLDPERVVAGRQLLAHVADLLESLPAAQRAVVLLRDVEGMEVEDVCQILGVSHANQRVLLHRGRSRIREGVEALLRPPQGRRTPTAVAGARSSTCSV
ncbi:MAG TPA: sigma-70 family RNA polymerase sigma factor [Stellaceae bacterium]|nr:sigma-70 family RNA polymerase sigma factor [Stellaceae bacterium]